MVVYDGYCTVLYCTVLYCTALLQVVVYDGYRPGDETIHHFWEVLLHYSELMQKKFLLFTTGQCFVIRDHNIWEDSYTSTLTVVLGEGPY